MSEAPAGATDHVSSALHLLPLLYLYSSAPAFPQLVVLPLPSADWQRQCLVFQRLHTS